MRPQLLIAADFDEQLATALEPDFVVHRRPAAPGPDPLGPRANADELAPIEAIVCETDVLDAQTLAMMPKLKLVISARANPVNVDLAVCRKRGIVVATTPARNAAATADLSIALLLNTLRRVSAAEAWLRSGNWRNDDPFESYYLFRGPTLEGRTLGIIGFGAVGRKVAERAQGFGMRVVTADPKLTQENAPAGVTPAALDEVFQVSDVVSVHVALTEKTRGLVGERQIAKMRPAAYLINASRAAVVQEAPLLAALREGKIAGAGFDVYWDEPIPKDNELLTLPNVVCTPHIGGASDDVITAHSRMAAAALRAWVAGEPVPNVWQ